MEGMGFHRKGVLWHIFGVLLSRAVGNYWKSLESLESLEPVGTVCWNLLEQGGYFVGEKSLLGTSTECGKLNILQ